ncbi:MAG: hypothetical protein ACE3JK_09940 [Sporolactobacillus sp.]
MSLSYIKSETTFKINALRLNRILNLKANFPKFVFKRKYNYYSFNEFDRAISEDLWTDIKRLSKMSEDFKVLLAVIDPDPEQYFKRYFGYYNWAEIPVDTSEDDYINLLFKEPPSSPADAIVFNSELIVWMPLSMQWAIFANRSYNLCVLATDCQPKLDASWGTLNSWIGSLSLEFSKKDELQAFIDMMNISYPIYNKKN